MPDTVELTTDANAKTDVKAYAGASGPHPDTRVSRMAAGLSGSDILKIAWEIRGLQAQGKPICDLTVGDFNPRYFPIPKPLLAAIRDALEKGETNYPPTTGLVELRQAVQRFYARELSLDYPEESILIASGSRPAIFGFFTAVCDPGDRVVYGVPSWNNHYYTHLVGAVGVPVYCRSEDRFMPSARALAPALRGARLLCLNSPLNPTGTVIAPDALRAICEAVLEENRGRNARGERPLYVLYDQVYWMLCFGDAVHVTPPGLIPEMAQYTLLVDGISKSFAGTGVRVGWALGPTDVIIRMGAIIGHAGAWAPRAEQRGVVAFLDDREAVHEFSRGFKREIGTRLDLLYAGIQAMKAEGLPVEAIPPMGAIYLTAQLRCLGRTTPAGNSLTTSEDVRRFVLEAAGMGIVPFQAFGVSQDEGWFRLSVGASGEEEIRKALPRLAAALHSLR